MFRLNGFVRPITGRFISTSQNLQSTKLSHGGTPQNKIPHWDDENVNIGFQHGRSDVRAQRFKKQTQKNAVTRRSRMQIVDNSKWATAQMHVEPEFVISYRKQRRFHNGSVGDLCLITVDGEFKRALYVGQTKPNQTFKAYYDTNMVVIIDDEGAPAGTRILAPLPSWLRDPKVHLKFEAYKFQDVQMNKILAICPRFVMTSLADELLADLEDEEEDIEDEIGLQAGEAEIKDEVKMEVEEVQLPKEKIQSIDDVDSVIELLDSKDFAEAMESIKDGLDQNPKPWFGLVEQNPEYQLVVKANELCSKIDNEIAIVHKFVQDMYQDRFPELAGMVPEPIIYLKTVDILMNEIEKGLKKLDNVLTPQTILIVSVTASTTSGKKMEEDKLPPLKRGCDVGIQMCEARDLILKFVESRMEFIAPNVCQIVGPGIAAKVTSHAGGLTALTKMPSCNIMLLGAQKKTLQGFSRLQMLPHTGYIYYAKIVQDLPPEFRRKAAKLVSAKMTLAARSDCFHQSDDGTHGKKLLEEIQTKFDKWFEPAQVKQTKALPVPLEAPRKKRGGRRARKMKERLGMTDMRKFANRMNFGEIGDDVDQSDLGADLGQLTAKGASGSGKVRVAPVDKKTQVRISKALQQKIARNNSAMRASALGGTMSVLAGGGRN